MAFQCPSCGEQLRDEHQHWRCDSCGLIEPCCDGAPGPAEKVDAYPEAARGILLQRLRRDLCSKCIDFDPDTWPDALCAECSALVEEEGWWRL